MILIIGLIGVFIIGVATGAYTRQNEINILEDNLITVSAKYKKLRVKGREAPRRLV